MTLHLLSLIGGWPGALVAQSVLRHKSRKQPFRVIFWLTVILNCAALAWLSTPGGRAAIDSLRGYRGTHRISTAFALNVASGEFAQLLVPGDNIVVSQTGLG